ncbi:RHS repeat domain-containing protein [Synechococcus sp. PCC 7336]|uniref:RHS repeat domain-containing protein n=1 Tax=Synechococcus sp. PCC 7336 TaxID=195250 RepID=UPI0003449409|nr:RHS repeat-associated core domain-containing protein [Synechococcus sp. PCC 7336]
MEAESSHGDVRTFSYDATSNRISMVNGNGFETLYSYDELNRRIGEQGYNELGELLQDYVYEFDAADQLKAAGDAFHRYSYSYDLAGRATSVSNAGSTGVPQVDLAYGYDAANNRTSVTDTIAGVETGLETFEFDLLNRVTRLTQSGANVAEKSVTFGYDAASQMTSVGRFSDLAETQSVATSIYQYDLAGRLEQLTHANSSSTVADYGFTYDAASRITQLTSPDGESVYSYDQRNQLTGAEYDYQGNEDYTYDGNGNRTNAGYVTQERNQLVEDESYAYTYDGEGNRVTRLDKATRELETFEWDHRNRLQGVVTTDINGNIIETVDYEYDIFDRRIEKTVDPDGGGVLATQTERYVYDGEHIALVFDGQGNLTYRYLHGPAIDQVLAQEDAGGEVLWALTDHQGTVKDLLDSDGTLVNHISYDSFGNITGESNPDVEFRFGYTGREFDEETGNYYYRARYYDPSIGQFISQDPLSFGASDANLYRYVGNSVVNLTDPSGLFALPLAIPLVPVIVIAGLVVVGVIILSQTEVPPLVWPLKGDPSPLPRALPETDTSTDITPRVEPTPSPSPSPVPVPWLEHDTQPDPLPDPLPPTTCSEDNNEREFRCELVRQSPMPALGRELCQYHCQGDPRSWLVHGFVPLGEKCPEGVDWLPPDRNLEPAG